MCLSNYIISLKKINYIISCLTTLDKSLNNKNALLSLFSLNPQYEILRGKKRLYCCLSGHI